MRSISGCRGGSGPSSPPTYGFIYGASSCHRAIGGHCYQPLTACPTKRPVTANGVTLTRGLSYSHPHNRAQSPYVYCSRAKETTLDGGEVVPRPMPLYRPDSGGYDTAGRASKFAFTNHHRSDNKYSTLQHETSSSCSSSNPFDTLDV